MTLLTRKHEPSQQCEYGIHYEKVEDARHSSGFFLKEASILAYVEKKKRPQGIEYSIIMAATQYIPQCIPITFFKSDLPYI